MSLKITHPQSCMAIGPSAHRAPVHSRLSGLLPCMPVKLFSKTSHAGSGYVTGVTAVQSRSRPHLSAAEASGAVAAAVTVTAAVARKDRRLTSIVLFLLE